MRVLIVDDHPIIVAGCIAMLADETDIEVLKRGATPRPGFANNIAR